MSAPTRRSADILVFPAPTPPAEGAERLRQALGALDAAVTRQQEAVADWRSAIGALRARMSELGGSVEHYRDTLGGLGQRVETLRDTARRLQAQAAAMEAAARR